MRTARRSSQRRRTRATAEAARVTATRTGADRGRAPVRARLAAQRGRHARDRPRVRRHRREPLRRQEGDRRRRPLPRRPRGLRGRRRREEVVHGSAPRGRPWPATSRTDGARPEPICGVAEDLLAAGRRHRLVEAAASRRSPTAKRMPRRSEALVEPSSARSSPPTPSRCSPISLEPAGRTRPTCSRASRSSASARRASESATDVAIDAELFAFERAVASDAELELALGSKLEPGGGEGADRRPAARGQGVAADGRDREPPRAAAARPPHRRAPAPRGRRRRRPARLRDRHGHHRPTPLVDRAARAPRAAVSRRSTAGRCASTTIVDPAVLGGLRVQIGDDVIDGSVASRLSSLRQKLAG